MRADVRTGIEQMYARRSMTASRGESVSPACTGRNPCTPVDDDPASANHDPSRFARTPCTFPVSRCLSGMTRTARRGRISRVEPGRTLSPDSHVSLYGTCQTLWITRPKLSTVSTGLSTATSYTYIWQRSRGRYLYGATFCARTRKYLQYTSNDHRYIYDRGGGERERNTCDHNYCGSKHRYP
jgi:hypothetical protein